jgi:stage II sporulation protein AB (anti-sigma F factor)
MNDFMEVSFNANSENEAFIRAVAASFILRLNPTIQDVYEVKTIVSEAVTNAIIHGYEDKPDGIIKVRMQIDERGVHIEIWDDGCGIEDIEQALEPMYTSKAEQERSGLGFSIMEEFSDKMRVKSKVGEGTRIYVTKYLQGE